jgi:thiol-disulfide isomerase/thioredoxin
MMTRIAILMAILLTGIYTWCGAKSIAPDTVKPQVNSSCPDFKLNYVKHYPKKEVTLKDFDGKWLFLEFWFTGCTTCIKRLPEISELQAQFPREVQFLLVGYNGGHSKNIEEVFEKLRIKKGLNVAAAYDSVLVNRWGITSMPHVIIVDPKGTVRFITSGTDITKEKIRKMITGESVTFLKKDIIRPEFDPGAVQFRNTSMQGNVLSSSILTKWNGEKQYPGYEIQHFVTIPSREDGFRLAMVNLNWLYNTAYFGKFYFRIFGDSLYGKIWQVPILELRDESRFDYDFGEKLGKGLYNYHLSVPLSQITKENIMKYMQDDLERAFGYKASVEERDMPVWKLVANEEAKKKIMTRGGSAYNSSDRCIAAGFKVRNVPVKTFIMQLSYYLNEIEEYPFIDGTDLSGNIDMAIDADLTNLQDVKTELQKLGMDFVKSYQKMKVLVIRDP